MNFGTRFFLPFLVIADCDLSGLISFVYLAFPWFATASISFLISSGSPRK
jgi:hypothetical protein